MKRVLIGMALLLVAGCVGPVQHLEPDLSAEVETGRMTSNQAFNAQFARNDQRVVDAAVEASGLPTCVQSAAAGSFPTPGESGTMSTGAQLIGYQVDHIMKTCDAQFATFSGMFRERARTYYYASAIDKEFTDDKMRAEWQKKLTDDLTKLRQQRYGPNFLTDAFYKE
jgi:hypothetical protein